MADTLPISLLNSIQSQILLDLKENRGIAMPVRAMPCTFVRSVDRP